MAENRFGLFGSPTPEQVRQHIGRTGLEQDLTLGAQSPQAAIMTAAAMGGRLLGEGLTGYEDPAIAKARQMQEIKANAVAKTKSMAEFLPAYADGLYKAGYIDEAIQLVATQQQLRAQEAEIGKTQATTLKTQRETQSLDLADAKTAAQIQDLQSQAAKRVADVAQGWGQLDARQQENKIREGELYWDREKTRLKNEVDKMNATSNAKYREALAKKYIAEIENTANGPGAADSPGKVSASIVMAQMAETARSMGWDGEGSFVEYLSKNEKGAQYLNEVFNKINPVTFSNILAATAQAQSGGFQSNQDRSNLIGDIIEVK